MALAQKEGVQGKLGHHHAACQVLGPAPPGPAGNQGAADDGPQRRRRRNGNAVGHHGRAAVPGTPDVDDGAAGDGDGRAAEHAGEEACDEDGLYVLGCGRAEDEGGADKVGLLRVSDIDGRH